MTSFLTCIFTLLLIHLKSSKAILSPPNNLMVELLDFKATAKWLPGQGNPPGTQYVLEFITAQNMSKGMWIRPLHCTNIDIQICELTFEQLPNELYWNYFVRVKSTFKEMSSRWTTTSKSFQPYGDTLLSSPGVKISTEQKYININFSHLLERKKLTEILEYLIYLFENSPTGESKFIALISTSKSPYIFHDVSSGKNYCVSVSVSHQQASRSNNFKTTKCIFLSDSTRSFVLMVCIGAMLLFTFSTGIVLTSVCFNYMRPRIKNLRVPKVLFNLGTNQVLKQPLEEPQTILYTEDCVSTSDEDPKDSSLLYLQRENLTNVIINPSSFANVNLAEQPEDQETSKHSCKYTLATDLEQSDVNVTFEEDDDNMHSGSSESTSACSENHSNSAEVLPTITVDLIVMSELESYCPEENLYYSNDCEREEAAEAKDEETLFPDFSLESGYEPR